MSNSSGSGSDSEDVVARNRTTQNKYRPNFRFIKNLEVLAQTKNSANDLYETLSNNVVQDGMMKAPPVITTPEAENVPLFKEKLAEEENKDIEIEFEATPKEEIPQIYNTRALSKFSETYELENFKKNAMIIFNQESINGYFKRLGTEKDVEALKRSFKRFGFEVEERRDRTKEDLFKELEAFSNTDFTDYGCVAVAILTHGTSQGMLRARDMPYCEIELLKHFMGKPFLVSKPILFLIQACRGTKQTAGMPVHMAGRVHKDLDEEVQPYTLPVESDMLIMHSSYPGKPSHRNELHGTWFIQSLCSKIDNMADIHDFETIMTVVKREVAIDLEHKERSRKTDQIVTSKQMPVSTSTLIRKLYLKKFGDDQVYIRKIENTKQVSSNEVLDSGAPQTPMLLHGQCSCFLPHFEYIRNCLRYFVADNPEDKTAQGFLDVANTLKSEREFDATKEVMLRAICNHLMTNAHACNFSQYLYVYKN